MYFKRKIDDFLLNWKEDISHKPLIIKGARQIGKTESILHFAGNVYANVVYINFVLDKRFRAIVSDGYDVDTVIKNISLVDPNLKFVPGETVIIFDEIQEYPDVATCLKSFNIDRRFDIICSGSMLGINYKRFIVIALETKQIMKCILWTLKNFCGQKDIRRNTLVTF